MQKKFIGRAIKKIAAVSAGVALLGATMTGALAADLSSFPEPFVVNNVYDDATAFVTGDAALTIDTDAQSYLVGLFQYMSKEMVSTDGGVTVTNGAEAKEITLGSALTTEFDSVLGNRRIDSLFRGDINFDGSSYEVEEEIHLVGGGPEIVTSLTSGEDDYESDIFMHLDKKQLYYAYRFRQDLDNDLHTRIGPDKRLEINFLGHNLRITDVHADGDRFTAYVGEEHFLDQGESVVVDGKTVRVRTVGDGSAVIEVDGQTRTMKAEDTFLFAAGIEVTVDTIFYTAREADSPAVNLIVGDTAEETYRNNDAFIGEDTTKPDWKWEIKGLHLDGTTSDTVKVLRIYNDYRMISPRDSPPGVGECIELPKGYISVCLDSLTVEDSDLKEYEMEIYGYLDLESVEDGPVLERPVGWDNLTKQDSLKVWTEVDEGFRLMHTHISGLDNNLNVDNFYLYIDTDVGNETHLIYEDDNKEHYGGVVSLGEKFAEVDYDDTRNNVALQLAVTGADPVTMLHLEWAVDGLDDNLFTHWTVSGELAHLGTDADDPVAGDITWSTADTGIGTIENDVRTKYGIVVVHPNSEGKSDRVRLEVPPEQVKANVIVKHEDAVVSRAGAAWQPVHVTPRLLKASQVSDPTMYNLIVVGGPCANPLAEELFGVTCDGWGLETGEALVEMVDNGDKVALLVAGTTGEDTKRAGLALSNYKDYDFSGSSNVVKGTSLTDISVM